MPSYTITVEEKTVKKIFIESDDELTEEEMESIRYQGESGIPERFIEEMEIEESGEYPHFVSIDED